MKFDVIRATQGGRTYYDIEGTEPLEILKGLEPELDFRLMTNVEELLEAITDGNYVLYIVNVVNTEEKHFYLGKKQCKTENY